MEKEYLKDVIEPVDLDQIEKISELLNSFNRTSFQSRTLANCVEIFLEMLKDSSRPTIFLGIAGAIVPAGMKGVISKMVEKNLIDILVSTGANMYHDFVEALGGHHYIGSPHIDDKILNEKEIDRIYDTYADEKNFRMIDNKIMYLADALAKSNIKPISSRLFLKYLGNYINIESKVEIKKKSIIWNCWKYEVPIFVPALNDSSIGLALTQHYIKFLEKKKEPLIIDEIRDNYEIFQIKRNAKKTGVIYVGGGVPKNYIQQTAYLQDMFGIPDAGHDFGFQITTDSPQWGGLSGCTFKEGLSWGKEKAEGKYETCYCDSTIALPLIVKATLERCKDLKRKRLTFNFD